MNLSDLSATQLRQAASIKEQIEKLQKELTNLLGAPTAPPAPIAAPKKLKRTMNAAARKKLSDFHKARWAEIKAAKRPTPVVQKPKAKKKMSPAAKALLSAKLKEVWAKRKAAKTSKVTPARKAASKTAPAATPAPKKKWKLSAAGLARIKAANKAYWATKKAAKK